MDNKKIEIGDTVSVYFPGGDYSLNCEVLYIPCSPGDTWKLMSEDGNVMDVQMYERIILIKKKAN